MARLAASRFCLQGMALQNQPIWKIGSKFYFRISWSFINTLTFWPTSWLAVFYRVKIASFSHPIFFWLKCRVSRSVPGLLLGSLILSGLTSSSATEKSILVQTVATQSSHGNDTLAGRIQTVSSRFFSTSRNYHAVSSIPPAPGVQPLARVLAAPALGADEGPQTRPE